MTPTDQTSTLLEILGGSFPTTKHSGGRYLMEEREATLELICVNKRKSDKVQKSPFIIGTGYILLFMAYRVAAFAAAVNPQRASHETV